MNGGPKVGGVASINHPSVIHQNVNYNSLERGTRRKLPQVPSNGGGAPHTATNGTVNGGYVNSDLFTHSLPRQSKIHASSSRYVFD